MNDLLVWSLDKARQQTLNLVADLDDEQMCQQMVTGENHPTWTLGHLFLADCMILSLFQGADAPKMPQGWQELYAPGNAPDSNKNRYHSKKELVERLIETGEVRGQIISRLTSEDLAKPTPDPRFAIFQPTLGHILHYLLFHEGNHDGQLAMWRKLRKLPSGSGVFGVI